MIRRSGPFPVDNQNKGLQICLSRTQRAQGSYLDASVAGLRLGLDPDLSPVVVPPIPARVVPRVSALVGDDGRDGLGRIGLDEESVERGRGALGDRGGLMGGVGLVRVSAVDHPALRDVDAGSAAHIARASGALSRSYTWVPPSSSAAWVPAAMHQLRAGSPFSSRNLRLTT